MFRRAIHKGYTLVGPEEDLILRFDRGPGLGSPDLRSALATIGRKLIATYH
jgi:hypothetical protein